MEFQSKIDYIKKFNEFQTISEKRKKFQKFNVFEEFLNYNFWNILVSWDLRNMKYSFNCFRPILESLARGAGFDSQVMHGFFPHVG
jgi:hypothetical protein